VGSSSDALWSPRRGPAVGHEDHIARRDQAHRRSDRRLPPPHGNAFAQPPEMNSQPAPPKPAKTPGRDRDHRNRRSRTPPAEERQGSRPVAGHGRPGRKKRFPVPRAMLPPKWPRTGCPVHAGNQDRPPWTGWPRTPPRGSQLAASVASHHQNRARTEASSNMATRLRLVDGTRPARRGGLASEAPAPARPDCRPEP